jgi:tRNA C32,U32 (ribose-2'-O)-methylase TrmJ
MLLSYELYLTTLAEMWNADCRLRNSEVAESGNAECGIRNEKRVSRDEACSSSGLLPPLAEFQKVEKMFTHLEEVLLRIGFLDLKNPKRIMHTLRRIFGRAKLSDRDVAVLRGIFRQLEWYAIHYNQPKENAP